MKKILAMMLTILITLSMSAPVFAEEQTYKLTIARYVTGHTYEAYQIFSGELGKKDNKDILTNIRWGSAVSDPQALLKKVNEEPKLSSLHGATSAAALAAGLEKFKDNSEELDVFAATISSELKQVAGTSTENPGEQKGIYEISGLKAGYYLIKDKDGTMENKQDYYTKFILRMVNDKNIYPKGGTPAVKKEISTSLNGRYKDVEDFNISDTVYYRWTASMPNNLIDYEKYEYTFADTLPTGISFKQIEKIYFADKAGTLQYSIYDRSADADNMPESITLIKEKGDYTRDENGKITEVKKSETVQLNFANLKGLGYQYLTHQIDIIVEYSAIVNQDALIKTGMRNAVKLIFDNNPNGAGKGETPLDDAYAFTFQISVDKFEKDDPTEKLEDAEFVLYYETNSENKVTKHYAQVVTNEMVINGYKVNDEVVTKAHIGTIYGWTTNKEQATVLTTDENGYFRASGLDAGEYYLEETKAPAGYKLLEKAVNVNIVPTYNESDVTVKYLVNDIEQESETIKIANESIGSALPRTGGVGTTLFYTLGVALVMGSVVLLVTKKRMDVEM